MNKTLVKITGFFMGVFAFLSLALGYWGFIRGEWLLSRSDNPRLILEEQRIHRGTILDRYGVILAETSSDLGDDLLYRRYAQEGLSPITGYYSLNYGVAGIEGEYDAVLRGDSFISHQDIFLNDTLNRPQYGGDIRTTLDAGLQETANSLLSYHRGAIIVATVPDGEILAMASSPTFDPNNMDDEWTALVNDPSSPLLNRAIQGAYQPGVLFQTVVMAMFANGNLAIPEMRTDSAPYAVLGDGVVPCSALPSDIDTIVDAYIYGCPGPFAGIADEIDQKQLEMILDAFGLTPDYQAEFPFQNPIDPKWGVTTENITDTILGQSTLTLTPLQMAAIAGAISSNGALPQLHVIDAVRQYSGDWEEVAPVPPRGAISEEAANTLMGLMRSSAIYGAAREANSSTARIVFGHGGLALSGFEDRYNALFIGISDLPDGRSAVVAVVIENSYSSAEAARLGGQILAEAAHLFE